MQRAALVALGLEPMWFPTYYKDSAISGKALNYLFEPTYKVFWNPKCFDNCWYIDAFTVDATLLAAEIKGIWDSSWGPPPKIASNAASAKVGSLPKVMVYIACHKEHGTRAFFLYHGAKHGGKSSTKSDEGHMYEGFKFWYKDLTDSQLEHIKAMSYYSVAATLTKFETRTGKAARQLMRTDKFDPCYFLVRPLVTHRHPHADNIFSASSCQNTSPVAGTSSHGNFTRITSNGPFAFAAFFLSRF